MRDFFVLIFHRCFAYFELHIALHFRVNGNKSVNLTDNVLTENDQYVSFSANFFLMV